MKGKVRVRSFTDIDVLNLEKECADQATLYREHAELLAEANFEMDEASAELDVVKAELGFAIRAAPKKFGVERISEKAVEEAMVLQPEYQDAKKAVNSAKRAVGILKAAVGGLDHKKQSLENLTYLQGQGYYAEPKVPRGEIGERVKDARKQSVRHSIGGKNGD
jgi:hypothetical protein